MEKRLLFFFAITFVIMWGWFRLFPPPEMPLDAAAAEAPSAEGAVDVEPEPAVGGSVDRVPDPDESAEAPGASGERATKAVEAVGAAAEETFRVRTDRYQLVFTNRGAHLESVRLLEHEDAEGEPYELVVMEASTGAGVFPLDVRVASAEKTARIQGGLFRTDAPREQTVSPGRSATLSFSWADEAGLAVTKTITVPGDGYELGVEVSVRDGGEEIEKAILYGAGIGAESVQSRYAGVEKGVVDARGEVSLFAAGDVADGAGDGIGVEGVGVASHYFAALMIPEEEAVYGARLETATVAVTGEDGASAERQVITAALIADDQPAEFRLFMGPKKLELLETLGPGFASIIEFGDWMRYPALLLRSALMRIYEVVGNYGWAIVLLTFLINVVLVPLKHYSFVSMRKMQKLGPQIQRIKDRYRKVKPTDPRYQQMNQEVMGLYKEHNVNPVSGCLPMLLMIPFFFAFYRLLMASIELRHAPFFGWIQDLSAHDPLFVLPILMGLSQVATQRMTPQATADPVQAKVMSFMPIMFTFILAWAPAGLVLYWFSNNVVSMGQQVVTNKYLAGREEEEEAAKKKRKAKKTKKE